MSAKSIYEPLIIEHVNTKNINWVQEFFKTFPALAGLFKSIWSSLNTAGQAFSFCGKLLMSIINNACQRIYTIWLLVREQSLFQSSVSFLRRVIQSAWFRNTVKLILLLICLRLTYSWAKNRYVKHLIDTINS